MSSQFNNCATMDNKKTDFQESFEDDLEWEFLAATIAEEIELEYFNKGKFVEDSKESKDFKKE